MCFDDLQLIIVNNTLKMQAVELNLMLPLDC